MLQITRYCPKGVFPGMGLSGVSGFSGDGGVTGGCGLSAGSYARIFDA